MKRLTVDQTWEQCLAMWKWISRRCKGKKRAWIVLNVLQLKTDWLNSNGFAGKEIRNTCFFCEFDRHRKGCINGGCFCPARKIDKNFECGNEDYDYCSHPRKFYDKLKELNKIRLAKK